MKKINIKKMNIKKIKGIVAGVCALSMVSGVLLTACGSEDKGKETTEIVTDELMTVTEDTTGTTTESTSTLTNTTDAEITESETTIQTTEVENSENEAETAETIRETNPPEWVVDEDTGMLIDNSNFIIQDSDGIEHVMTREQYKKWLNGEYSWDEETMQSVEK